MSACTYCRRPILWGTTSAGKPMPLQGSPDRTGRYLLVRGEALTVEELLVRGEPWCDFVDGPRYAPHPAFCPNWPRKQPKRPISKAVVQELACERDGCGEINDTVRVGAAGARCRRCRQAETAGLQGVLG